jgi:hypothetical protein
MIIFLQLTGGPTILKSATLPVKRWESWGYGSRSSSVGVPKPHKNGIMAKSFWIKDGFEMHSPAGWEKPAGIAE